MNRLASLAVGACLLASLSLGPTPAQAQTAPPDSVEIGGWTLPEGAVVSSESRMVYKATIRRADGVETPYLLETSGQNVTRIDRVTGGILDQAVQRAITDRTVSTVGTQKGEAMPTDPLLGLDVTVTRSADGWTRTASSQAPTDEQMAALAEPTTLDDAEYPARMAVGQTVEVPRDAIARVYLGLSDAPARLTVRLDSLGTADGGPAAFLTQTVDVTTAGDGYSTHMTMTARIVRRLDWRIDVSTHWTGRMATDYGAFVIDGFADHRATQTVDRGGADG